ncbi:unnamed protein product [Lampetra planeri]
MKRRRDFSETLLEVSTRGPTKLKGHGHNSTAPGAPGGVNAFEGPFASNKTDPSTLRQPRKLRLRRLWERLSLSVSVSLSVRARPPSSSVDRVLPSPGGKAARARDGRGHRVCCSPARPPARRGDDSSTRTPAQRVGGRRDGARGADRAGRRCDVRRRERGREARRRWKGDRRDEARMDIARRDNDSCKPKEQSVTVRGEEK